MAALITTIQGSSKPSGDDGDLARRFSAFGRIMVVNPTESIGNYRLTMIFRVGMRRQNPTSLSVKARFFADFELAVEHTATHLPPPFLTLVARQDGFFRAFFSEISAQNMISKTIG